MKKSLFKNKWKMKKISTRIMCMFLGITVVVFSIFFAIISSLFSDKLTEEMNVVATQQLEFASSILDSNITEIRNYYYSVVKNKNIQEILKERNNLDKKSLTKERHVEQLSILKKELEGINLSNNVNVRSSFVVSKNREILDPLYQGETYDWLVKNNIEYTLFLDSPLTMRLSSPNSFPFQNAEGTPYENYTETCFGRIYDEKYEDIGYLAININRKNTFRDMENVFQETFSRFYVVDENQNIVFSNVEDIPATKQLTKLLKADYARDGEQISMGNTAYKAYSEQIDAYPNWKIVGFIDFEYINRSIKSIFITTFIIFCILLFFAAIINYYLAKHITLPIRSLNDAMRTVRKGEWPTLLEVKKEDEMSEMLEGFNKMNLSLQKMTTQIATQQEEARKNEVALVQSQLDLLESQINPHFIHNTLNTMKYMAKVAHAENLENLITSFNALLRTSMATDNMMTPLIEEIENLYHYMDIQKQRYDMEIDFQCTISEDAHMVFLPKLILQPLIENSLFHGIAPNDGGRISVNASAVEQRLWIIVWDDGAGIPIERLELLKKGLIPSNRGYNSIGVANVNERLILSYGASSHMVIESTLGKGTSFSFSIPI